MASQSLAHFGGPKAVQSDPGDMFNWPIITQEDEEAVLEVLRRGGMSGTDVTKQFESEFAAWQSTRYTLAHSSGTAALHCAMFGCNIGVGDEIICPRVTYWASALQCFSLGATVVFADIDPNTLCIDPDDIEHRISEHTKAIMVVHYLGHPAEMDAILSITRRYGVKMIEDVSHAQGGLYNDRKLGTFGDVATMSLMSGKSFAIGEAGILATDNLEIYELAIAFGHYQRFGDDIQAESLKPYAGLPLGGYKYRMHQLSSAVGKVQLKHYDSRCGEIRQAMNHFWDLLDGVPGLRAHRTPKDSDSNMAGWYNASGLYRPEELGGLSVTRFAEGVPCQTGVNDLLHLHPLLNTYDVYGHDRPTRIAFANRDLRQPPGSLPISENIGSLTYRIPWFKHHRPEIIDEYANAFRKVAENYLELLPDDTGNPTDIGGWHFFSQT